MLIFTYGFLHLILGGELLDLTLSPAQSLLQRLQHSRQLQPHHRRHITLRQLGAPAHQLTAQLAQLFRIRCIGQAGALGCLLRAVLLLLVGPDLDWDTGILSSGEPWGLQRDVVYLC